MLWNDFSQKGKTPLAFLNGKQKAGNHHLMLKDYLTLINIDNRMIIMIE